jgi:signal transduction histidine kinase
MKSKLINYKIIKLKLMLMITIILSIFSIVTYYSEKNTLIKEMKSKQRILNKSTQKVFDELLFTIKKTVTERIRSTVKNNPNILKKFSLKDRDGLYEIMKKEYSSIRLSNEYIKIMTFRLVDNSAFLRVHRPKMYGDKLNQKRKIIVDTNRLKVGHFGFEVGKLKISYRVVTPLFYNNKYIGLIEIGIEPEYIIDKLKKIFNLKSALLVKSNMKTVSLDKIKYKKVDQEFYLARGDKLFYDFTNEISLHKKHNHIIYNKNTYHISSSINIKDHKNNIAAKILFAYSINKNKEELRKVLKHNIYTIAILFIILLIGIEITVNYFINQIKKPTEELVELNKKLDEKAKLLSNQNKELEENRNEIYSLNKTLEARVRTEVDKNTKQQTILFEQAKMVSMGEMIGNIAHQWRQPLSAISATSNNLTLCKEFGTLDDDIIDESTELIDKNIQYLSNTIDTFRDFIKEKKELKKIVLQERIDGIIRIIGSTLKNKHIELRNKIIDTKKVNITIVVGELDQVIINIINNSKDILIEKKIKNPWIELDLFIKDNYVFISIEDNGGGIPEDIMPKIFIPYFTTKHESQGTGLGLHMSKKIVHNSLKGSLYVENTKNGAKFFIKLPI